MKKFITKQLTVVLGIASVLVVTNGAISYFNTHQLSKNEPLVTHTHQVFTELESTFLTLFKDAKQGSRTSYGDYIWLETISRAMQDVQTGEIVEIHASSRDVTARQQVEEALKESNKRLRANS